MSDLEYSDEEYYDDEDAEMLEDDDDDTGPSEDMDVETGGSGKDRGKPYDVAYSSLSQAAVEKRMADDIEHVSGLCGVDASNAALLLRHLRWNKEKLIEQYMDHPDKLSIAAGIAPVAPASPSASSSAGGGPTRRTTRRTSAELAKGAARRESPKAETARALGGGGGVFVCPICCLEQEPGGAAPLALGCGHAFCGACWAAYASARIRGEGEAMIRCMAEGCGLVAPDAFVERALLAPSDACAAGDRATAERFGELLVRDYVGCDGALKFCPYPACTYTVSCPAAASRAARALAVPTVRCGAEHVFCFGCDVDGDHRPCICAVARLWLKKCADDSETANWIKSNTKECTKCMSTIEKNGGCNHMTCKKCKWEFCWVCMGPWSEHGSSWYSCNRYDEKEGVAARDAQTKSRASLERYLHYYNRWANHEQSAKLSLELYAKTEKKMEAMQLTSRLTWIEVQFMRRAVDDVIRCRGTLKWTYAMAYYLARGNEKELYEDNQRDLERAVEELSELLEGQIDPDTIADLKQKVTDKAVYVSKRNEILLKDTAKGFQDGRWKWNVSVEGFELDEIVPSI